MDIVWVPKELYNSPGRVGVASMPGFEDHSILADLTRLVEHNVTHLVCLVEEHELARLEPPETAAQRASAVQRVSIAYLHSPVPDLGAPTESQARSVVDFATAAMAMDGSVLFHCGAGLGRAGTLAACVLKARGLSAADSMATVRWVRPGAIQSEVQEQLIHRLSI